MDDLLPYYEAELGWLRRYAREFADKYPAIAGRLQLSGEASEDPHVERLIQAYALLNARTARKLDQEYPQFTEALFEALYPHYLKPFPACSIVQVEPASTAVSHSGGIRLARGTLLNSRPVHGVVCRFRTCFDIDLTPWTVSDASFQALGPESPARIGRDYSHGLHITLQSSCAISDPLTGCLPDKLRVFLNGDASLCAALRDTLLIPTVEVAISYGSSSTWQFFGTGCLAEVGFGEHETLFPQHGRSHPAHQLLLEYFNFPEKFNFLDIDLSKGKLSALSPDCSLTLHCLIPDLPMESNAAKMLAAVNRTNLLLHCAPVVNLFEQRGEPIRVDYTTTDYPVLPDARRPSGYEVHSIDAVTMTRQVEGDHSGSTFRPIFALEHGSDGTAAGGYWLMRRDEWLAYKSPGHEVRIALIDENFHPASTEVATLSLKLKVTNRNLPSRLTYGNPQGDLFVDGATAVKTANFLMKPTPSVRMGGRRGAHWRLVSLLSVSHLGLLQGEATALKEVLQLHNFSNSRVIAKQIASIRSLIATGSSCWIPGNPFNCLVRGTDVTVVLDDRDFVGTSIQLFGAVLERFFSLYAYVNSYVRLVIVSEHNSQELYRCEPRTGIVSLL